MHLMAFKKLKTPVGKTIQLETKLKMRPIGKDYSSLFQVQCLKLIYSKVCWAGMTLISDGHGHLNEVIISESGCAVPHRIPLLELCCVYVGCVGGCVGEVCMQKMVTSNYNKCSLCRLLLKLC